MCQNIKKGKRRLLGSLRRSVGKIDSDTLLNTYQYLEPQAHVVNRMKKGKLASKAVLENKYGGKKGVEHPSHYTLLYRHQIPLLDSAFHFSVNGIKHMLYEHWHLAQKFDILADSGLKSSVSQT